MTVLASIFQIWRDAKEGWRELFPSEPILASPLCSDEAEDDPRVAEARASERIELAIMTAHFHF